MRRAILLCLLLAGCASGEQGPCQPAVVADLPADTASNRLLVPGSVNGLPTTVQVDTGSDRTIITETTVAALQLPRSQRTTTRLAGVGGAVSNADVFAELDVGRVSLSRRFAETAIGGFGALLGGDVLSDYDVDLDLPHGRVRLWRAHGCALSALPVAGTAVPFAQAGEGRIRLEAAVDGKPVRALLDTGAAFTLLQAEAAAALGVGLAALAGDPARLGRGVDGGAIAIRRHRFTSLTVGGKTLTGAEIGVSSFSMDDAAMLLGMDWLRGRRVWVSYRLNRLVVQ